LRHSRYSQFSFHFNTKTGAFHSQSAVLQAIAVVEEAHMPVELNHQVVVLGLLLLQKGDLLAAIVAASLDSTPQTPT
jgi:hypothetical protein